MDLIALFLSSLLINNIVLMQFLGLCSFFGVSTKMKSVIGMSLAVIVVTFLAAAITYPIYHYVLVDLNIEYISTIAFILVIAALVQLTELVVKKVSKSLYRALGVYLPLIATNCAVLGVSLTNVSDMSTTYPQALVYALGSAMGYGLVIIAFAAIRIKLNAAGTPKALKGMPIALVTASLMALAFMGLAGII